MNNLIATFRLNIVDSILEDDATTLPRNIGNRFPIHAASYNRRTDFTPFSIYTGVAFLVLLPLLRRLSYAIYFFTLCKNGIVVG